MSTSEKMVIVGFGWVGQANALAMKILGYEVSYFDPGNPPRHYTGHTALYDAIPRLPELKEKDSEHTWYIVCVGDRVSEDGTQDISNIQKALNSLSGVRGGVMLRSTILPDLLKNLKFDYYVPEFLHEKMAVDECVNPYLLVIGSLPHPRPEPSIFNMWRSKSRKTFEGTPHDASLIKYLSNLWNATRIAFVNEFGDMIGRPSTKEELASIAGVIDFLFDGRSYLRYGRSFGGHCLPKDSRAFAAWYGKGDVKPLLLKAMYVSNDQHRALEEKYPLMPEWYSNWPDPHISGWHALRELRHSLLKYVLNPALIAKRFTKRG
ncbi:MAG: Uncharacterized protein G01um10148_319 [Parcubacteria group bacterium Gr01-1014_8]|nr:MAG: Uncharacterized protein G01um10148_319 [Parcubacteria group bacterium Gr01-1014_8]